MTIYNSYDTKLVKMLAKKSWKMWNEYIPSLAYDRDLYAQAHYRAYLASIMIVV